MCHPFCLYVLFPHTYCGIIMTDSIVNELSKLLSNIQIKQFDFNVWNPSIRYSEIIKKMLKLKLRNSLKEKKIKILNMTGFKEDYFELQIVIYLYTKILAYFSNTDFNDFNPYKLDTKLGSFYKIPDIIINNVEFDYMETFRNYIVKLKNSSINIGTTDKSEKIILHEKLEIIIKDVIEKIDMDDIIEKIEDTYNNIQTIENKKTEVLRNNM